MSRVTLWQTLRRQVRAGDAVGAEATAIKLGYTKREGRKAMIERIHKRNRARTGKTSGEILEVRRELEKPPAEATPKSATDKQRRHR